MALELALRVSWMCFLLVSIGFCYRLPTEGSSSQPTNKILPRSFSKQPHYSEAAPQPSRHIPRPVTQTVYLLAPVVVCTYWYCKQPGPASVYPPAEPASSYPTVEPDEPASVYPPAEPDEPSSVYPPVEPEPASFYPFTSYDEYMNWLSYYWYYYSELVAHRAPEVSPTVSTEDEASPAVSTEDEASPAVSMEETVPDHANLHDHHGQGSPAGTRTDYSNSPPMPPNYRHSRGSLNGTLLHRYS